MTWQTQNDSYTSSTYFTPLNLKPMFLASFALFTRAFTSFLRLKRGLIFFAGACLLSVLILFLITRASKQRKPFFFANCKRLLQTESLALLLAGIVITFTLLPTDQNLISNFFSFAPLRIESPQSAFTPFMEEVLILEQTKPNTYIVETNNGKTYFLKTEMPHQIGKSLYLGATLKTIDPSKLYTELLFSGGRENFRDYQFNYDKRLLMKGISGTLYEKFSLPAQQNKIQASWLHHQLSTSRTRLKECIQKVFPDKEAALLLGMLIGDKSQLETGAYQNFVNSGIVHIIAVSGGNLVMIVVFLSAVLFRVPFYIRNGLIILGVIAFALLCGGDSSVLRALIMAVLSLLAVFRGREIKIWRLLKYAFVLMLCYNPFFLIYDLGFLLSFGAVIGIVLINEWRTKFQKFLPSKPKVKEKKIWLPFLTGFLKNYGLPTLGATLGSLPILLFFIGETNLTGVLINLLIVPLVPIITIGGFITVIIVIWTHWLWLALPLQWLLTFIFRMADLANSRSFSISISATWAKRAFLLLIISIGAVTYQLSKKE